MENQCKYDCWQIMSSCVTHCDTAAAPLMGTGRVDRRRLPVGSGQICWPVLIRKIRPISVSEQSSCPRFLAATDLRTSSSPSLLIYVYLIDMSGNAVALHSCHDHSKIIGKWKFQPPVESQPSKFHSVIWHTWLRLGRHPTCKFWGRSAWREVLPKYVKLTLLWLLACPYFFSILSTGHTAAPAYTLDGSNDVFPRKEVPFGARMKSDAICGKYPPPKWA